MQAHRAADSWFEDFDEDAPRQSPKTSIRQNCGEDQALHHDGQWSRSMHQVDRHSDMTDAAQWSEDGPNGRN
jgi:hypothetical protein